MKGQLELVLQDTLPRVPNPNHTILLEGRDQSGHSHPDLLVSMERCYLHLDWNSTHELLHQNGAYMLTIKQFSDFIYLLVFGRGIYDGYGNRVSGETAKRIFDSIFGVREPPRGEFLNARSVMEKGLFGKRTSIIYPDMATDGTLEGVTERLKKHLTRGGMFDLDHWITKQTSYGLPTKEAFTEKGYKSAGWYYPPRDGTVAAFCVDQIIPDIVCKFEPDVVYRYIGVRPVYLKASISK